MRPMAALRLSGILALLLGWPAAVVAETTSATTPVAPSGAVAGSSNNITLNLKGADLETLVETVAKATGKNFVLDPKVQGKVTVVSHKPVSGDELYAMFLSILEVHGFMAVPVGNVIKILPDNDLKYQAKSDSMASGGSDEVVAQVFSLRFVDAGRIIPVLRPMLGPKAHMSAHPDTNSLVISGRSAEIARLEKLLERVDRPFTETIETVTLEHAKASDVQRIASELSKIMAPDNSQEKVVIVADERTNSILLGGHQDARVRMRMIIGKLDGAVEVSGNTRVIGLKYAKAEELAKVLANMGENYLKDNKQENNKGNSLVNVQAYTGDNSLVISAPVDLLRSMTEVVRVLDRRRKQVMVKAIIAEVSNDKVAELGIQWGNLGTGNEDKVIGGINFPSANPGLLQLGAASKKPESQEAVTVVNSLAGLLVGGTDGTNLIALLRALKSDADTNILSTPSIVTLDNEEAEIVVGQEVPFITSSTTNNAGNPFQTITRENVGLSLKVRPLVTEGDTVRMDIDQEVSSLLPDAANITLSDAVTRTRRIKTSVLVENQQILVLGGLIQDDMQQTTAKVPFLGDLPLLGTMFRAERSADVKTNLMVFLRPQILHTETSGDAATEESYRIMRSIQLEVPEIKGPVKLDEKPPILPEWGEQLRMSRRVEHREILQEDLPASPGGTTEGNATRSEASPSMGGSISSAPETGATAVGDQGKPVKVAVDSRTVTAREEGKPVAVTVVEDGPDAAPSVMERSGSLLMSVPRENVEFFGMEKNQSAMIFAAPKLLVSSGDTFSETTPVTTTGPRGHGTEVSSVGPAAVGGKVYRESQDYGD
ncbi:MAG: type II secretion system secretin GspD [Magnetococcales bacterium]|nr:type II secretion system secretin GspD [Magnetococcales bacterium]